MPEPWGPANAAFSFVLLDYLLTFDHHTFRGAEGETPIALLSERIFGAMRVGVETGATRLSKPEIDSVKGNSA
jgi:hypothetical protein